MTITNETALAEQFTVAYTDGSCINNPGKGGWAWMIKSPDGTVASAYGHVADETTNIRMKMLAVVQLLEATAHIHGLIIRTNCDIIVRGAHDLMSGWKANKWKKSNGKIVANCDLWMQLDELLAVRGVGFEYAKAHKGIFGNETADKLAYRGALNE